MTTASIQTPASGLSVAEIATLTGAVAGAATDPTYRITGIAALDLAGPRDLVFFDKSKFADAVKRTAAKVCLTSAALAHAAPAGMALLQTPDPYRAFVTVACALFPQALRPSSLYESSGRAEGAFVHPQARLEDSVTVDPGAVIGPRAEIGTGTLIGAGAVIGPDVRIGRDCSIGANVTITNAIIGDRVVLHPGVRIGQDGFGYLPGRSHRKVPQIGRVIIQDDVEIGANSAVDRGGLRDTVIGEGTKIDNLVQIGHNVQIGRHCILVALAGVAGTCTIGDYAVLGGQVGLADHTVVGEGAQLAAQSGAMGDVPAGEKWAGSPAMPIREQFRATLVLRDLARRGASRADGNQKDDGEAT